MGIHLAVQAKEILAPVLADTTLTEMMKIPLLACLAATASLSGNLQAGETVIKDSQGMDCFVYLPDPIVPGTTYQLVVGVHGAGGNRGGAAGMKDWAQRGDVIVIGPSFVTKGDSPYQIGTGIHAEKLIDLFVTLKKTYKLRDKMFLHGFSGGSQFVHRFTMGNSELVCGVSAHSGGSWATDNVGSINSAAKNIPFAISCGEKDTAKSTPGTLFTRLEWYGRFKDEIDKEDFCYIGATWPGVGHSMSAGAWDLAKQCFQIATGLPGQSATEKIPISPEWKNLDSKQKAASASPTPKPAPGAPSVSAAELDKMALAAFRRADSEQVPDELLIGFMKKYPPASWKEKPGSAKLLEQCKQAAEKWHAAAKTNGKWNDSTKKQFAQFADGLDVKTEP